MDNNRANIIKEKELDALDARDHIAHSLYMQVKEKHNKINDYCVINIVSFGIVCPQNYGISESSILSLDSLVVVRVSDTLNIHEYSYRINQLGQIMAEYSNIELDTDKLEKALAGYRKVKLAYQLNVTI